MHVALDVCDVSLTPLDVPRLVQFLFSFCEERNNITTCFPSSEISSYVWITVWLSPLLVVILSEATKRADSKLLDNEYSNRRFMFDTRLGCYSPR